MVLGALVANAAFAEAEDTTDYLSFTAKNGSVRIEMVAGFDKHTFEWSADKQHWTEFEAGLSNMTVHAFETVYFRRKGDPVKSLNWLGFKMTPEREGATIAAGGNAMSLLDASCTQTEVGEYAFTYLFYECAVLTAAPKLPATTLGMNCYQGMFSGCTALTVAPELPATTLAYECYREMFRSCESLVAAPELPATLRPGSEGCYVDMFVDESGVDPQGVEYHWACRSLRWIKTGLIMAAPSDWMKGVSGGGTFVTPSKTQERAIPSGWTRVDDSTVCLVTVPRVAHLKATVTANGSAVMALEYAGSTRWMVEKNAAVQVDFTADEGCLVKEGMTSYSISSMTADVTFGTTEGYPLPEVVPPLGKWTQGDFILVTLNARGVFAIEGKGAMSDFASAADVPWAALADKVETVTIADDVTVLGWHAFDGMPDTATIFGLPLAFYRRMTHACAPALDTPVLPPEGAVTTWEALTNAIATAESGAVIAVGADITEPNGELVVPAGKAVTIRLYGKKVSCGRVTVGGALTVGDAEDSVGRIVASDGAKVAKGGSVTLLGGPMRGTFTTLSPGLILLFK